MKYRFALPGISFWYELRTEQRFPFWGRCEKKETRLPALEKMRMDVKRLRYFCTIVEQGQISRAARVLHISQPPLSQRLKELEDELGTPLIIREDGQWQITEAGKILYEKANSILSDLDNLSDKSSIPQPRSADKSVSGYLPPAKPNCLPCCRTYINDTPPYVFESV